MPSSKTTKTAKTTRASKSQAPAARAVAVAPKARKATTEKKTSKESSDFIIGDYVVYPMHGVGQICSIKRETILGERKPCYIFEIASSKMKVTIPTEKARQIGIRPIIGKREVKKVLDLLLKEEVDTEEDWKIRYQNNMNKIKSGSIYSVAEVCRDLYKRARDKELSLMERRLYESAYSLISSEIALSRQVSQEEAGNMISEVLSAS